MNVVNQFNQTVIRLFSSTFNRDHLVATIVKFLLIVYIAHLSPDVPPSIEKLFQNQYFRVAGFMIIFMFAKVNPALALLLSVAFIMTMNHANNKPLWEMLSDVIEEQEYDYSKEKSMFEQLTDTVTTTLAPIITTLKPTPVPTTPVAKAVVAQIATTKSPVIATTPAVTVAINKVVAANPTASPSAVLAHPAVTAAITTAKSCTSSGSWGSHIVASGNSITHPDGTQIAKCNDGAWNISKIPTTLKPVTTPVATTAKPVTTPVPTTLKPVVAAAVSKVAAAQSAVVATHPAVTSAISNVVVANPNAKPADVLAHPAVASAIASVKQSVASAPPDSTAQDGSSCYPIRHYDMSGVVGADSVDKYSKYPSM